MLLSALAVSVSLAVFLAACADSSTGSAPGAGEVVVKVGSTPITRAQVNHWMGVLAAQDYYELSRLRSEPANLVSDPPRYGACVQRLEAALATAASTHKRASQAGVQLLAKCRELNQEIKAQAVSFLIALKVAEALAAEQRVSASEAEVRKVYEASTAAHFHSKAEHAAVQAARRTSPADEMVVYRKDVLVRKVFAKLKASGVGLADVARVQAALRVKTDCRAGYVVEQCKQFHGESPNSSASPSTSVLEQIVTLVAGRCTNLSACSKP